MQEMEEEREKAIEETEEEEGKQQEEEDESFEGPLRLIRDNFFLIESRKRKQTYIHAEIYAYLLTCKHANIHTNMHICMHTSHIHTNNHANIETHIHTYMHSCIHITYIHTCIHILYHKYLLTHTDIQTYKHTDIQTHRYILFNSRDSSSVALLFCLFIQVNVLRHARPLKGQFVNFDTSISVDIDQCHPLHLSIVSRLWTFNPKPKPLRTIQCE